MLLAHHFPGLGMTPERLDAMTPEATAVLVAEGKRILKAEEDERWAAVKLIATACGARF